MADKDLRGKRVAILATDGFEQQELLEPRAALEKAGAKTAVVAPKGGSIRGWKHDDWGDEVKVDITLERARSADFDALLLPGGVMSPDELRRDARAVELIREFFLAGKPVAAICHGPWLLVEAGVVRERTLTSWPSLRTDIRNAGGRWTDREVVVDAGLVTSRMPDDIPAFNRKMIEEFSEAMHEGQRVGRRERDDVRSEAVREARLELRT